MRTATIGFVVLALLAAAAAAPASEPIRPEQYRDRVTLTVESAERSYWTMDAEQPLELTVRGPGRVKLITRLALGSAREGRYGLVVHEGGTEVKRESLRTMVATGVVGAEQRWGCHRDVIFPVPAGEHRYRVSVTGASAAGSREAVAVRPRFLAPKKSVRRVSLSPARYERVLVLIRDEKEITYYRVSRETPVEVTVIGPTELQINTRLDFGRTMNGDSNSYAVEVSEGETTLARAHFEVQRSQVAAWRDQPDVIPGVVKGLRVPLPEGTHHLVIRLTDTVAGGAGVKLYIPEDDVSLAASD